MAKGLLKKPAIKIMRMERQTQAPWDELGIQVLEALRERNLTMGKIAVSSQGNNLDSQMDPRFGRAAYFLVFDDQDGSFVVLDNGASREMSSGAGIQAAEAVARSGAKTVLSGVVGPKALTALEAAGLKVVQGAEGSVKEALQAFKRDGLASASQAPASESQPGSSPGAGRGVGGGGGRGVGGGGGRGMGGGGGGRGRR